MSIKGNLRKITELGIGITAVTTLALAGCGGGGSSTSGNTTAVSATLSGIVSTFAGTALAWGVVDLPGSAARFVGPSSITSDGTYLYVTDSDAHNIRKILISTGAVTTLAGSTIGVSGVVDATGVNARFRSPFGITIDSSNTKLYVADSGNNNIRQIDIATGTVTTIAGSSTGISGASDAVATNAGFNFPVGISRIGTNLYVADYMNCTIRKIDTSAASAVVTTLAGNPAFYGYNDGFSGTSVRFFGPAGLTTDGSSLYLTDLLNQDVRKINPTSGYTTIVAGGNFTSPASGVGSTDASGTLARFYNPRGITTDGTNLFVADSGNHTIRKIFIASGAVTTLAGSAGISGVTDATGSSARFAKPYGIIYVNGTLYAADWWNGTIRKIQ